VLRFLVGIGSQSNGSVGGSNHSFPYASPLLTTAGADDVEIIIDYGARTDPKDVELIEYEKTFLLTANEADDCASESGNNIEHYYINSCSHVTVMCTAVNH